MRPSDYFIWLLEKEWALKASLEARAGALLSAQTSGVAAALAVLALMDDRSRDLVVGDSRSFAIGALVAYALSLLTALAATIPRFFQRLSPLDGLDQKYIHDPAITLTPEEERAESAAIAYVIFHDLVDMRKSNRWPAVALLLAYLSFVVAIGLFAVALLHVLVL